MTFAAILGIVFTLGTAFLMALMKVYKAGPWLDLTQEDMTPPTPTKTPHTSPVDAPMRLYKAASSFIGEHLALDNAVSPEVGCVTAVAFILKACGYNIPKNMAGTLALIDWMIANGFQETKEYTVGAVVTAHNPNPNIKTDVHVGICGNNWIMSNTSYDDPSKGLKQGIFQANFKKENWAPYYTSKGSVTRFFVPVDKAPTVTNNSV